MAGIPALPVGGQTGIFPLWVARSGGHPVWANTEQAEQHLVKLSIQRAAQPEFSEQYARAREGCMKLPMVATACYQKSWFKRALLPTAHPGFSEQYARAREAQPDLKSQWVRLPRPKGVQKRHSL